MNTRTIRVPILSTQCNISGAGYADVRVSCPPWLEPDPPKERRAAAVLVAPQSDSQAPVRFSSITERRVEVARLKAAGMTNPQVAASLGVSVDTVQNDVWRIRMAP